VAPLVVDSGVGGEGMAGDGAQLDGAAAPDAPHDRGAQPGDGYKVDGSGTADQSSQGDHPIVVPDQAVTADKPVVTTDQHVVTTDQHVVTPDQHAVTPDQQLTTDQPVVTPDQHVILPDQRAPDGGSTPRTPCTGLVGQCPAGWDCLVDNFCHQRCTAPTDPCGAISSCSATERCVTDGTPANAWCVDGAAAGDPCGSTVACRNNLVCSSVNGSSYICRPICSVAGAACGAGGTCLQSTSGCRFCSMPY